MHSPKCERFFLPHKIKFKLNLKERVGLKSETDALFGFVFYASDEFQTTDKQL